MKKGKKAGSVLGNDWYAMKLGSSISKSRVLHSFLTRIISNFMWVFFSGYFLRYIVDALDKNKDFSTILIFILIWGGVFFLLNLYLDYVENVVVPLTNTKIYHGIYERLYQKAKNVELCCYEDSDFYNRYTMAADHAEENK